MSEAALAPERLLEAWLGPGDPTLERLVHGEPFMVPYDRLAALDGWCVWLGHPPVPEGLPLLPAPDELLWDEPELAVATGLLVAADYAIRRGATTVAGAAAVLRRESPVALIAPERVHRGIDRLLDRAGEAGIPVLRGSTTDSQDAIRAAAPSFAIRAAAHAVELSRPHDPALSFQPRSAETMIGVNELSSFVVHNQGERDSISIDGELSQAWALSVGLAGGEATVESTVALEDEVSQMPCYLDRVAAWRDVDSLAVGWPVGEAFDPHELATCIVTWLRGLFGFTTIDLRIAFGAPGRRSDQLAAMRGAARQFREFRAATLAGHPDPISTLADHLIE